MRIFATILTTATLLFAVSAQAEKVEEVSPYLVLENAGNSLFSRIASNQQEIKKFPELMQVIVEEELMPSIDYKYAAYKVLGKNLKKITKEQRSKFVKSMRHYLIRTYATALTQYRNQKVIFEPAKETKGKRIIGVKTQIIDQGAPTIDIVFQMRKNKKTGEWKAFDITVEGISLLSTKQVELNKKIARQGIDHVTLELASLAK